jgi:hemoglobin
MPDSLYARLGGYDAIAAVSDDLLVRLKADGQLARFWQHRGEDGLLREKQLLIISCARPLVARFITSAAT